MHKDIYRLSKLFERLLSVSKSNSYSKKLLSTNKNTNYNKDNIW